TSSPDVTLKPDRTLKIDDGALDATLAVADVTVHSDNPCAPKTAKVYAVARPNKNTTPTVLVLLTDQGILDAVSGADAMKILTSMRPDQ
ncbi:MAG: hypothetical protein JOZ47_20595, partial [Kutzneria sp.]|nr:hypothetical protein [Kutzneria sp.]